MQSTGNTGLRDLADSDQAALTNARQSFVADRPDRRHHADPRHVRRRRLAGDRERLRAALHAGPGVERHAHLQLHAQPRRVRGGRRLPGRHAHAAHVRGARLPGHLPRPGADRRPLHRRRQLVLLDRRRRAPHGRRRGRRRRGLRRDRARARPRDPGRAGARLRPGRRRPSSAPWARASATSSPRTSTSRTATPTYQAARRFCVMEWDATSYNPVVGGNPGTGCLRWDGRHRRGHRLRHRHLRRHAGRGARRRPLLVGDADLRVRGHRALARHRRRPATACSSWCSRITRTSCRPRPTPRSPTRSSRCAWRTTRASRATEIARINTCGEQRLGIGRAAGHHGAGRQRRARPGAPDGANGWYRSRPTVDVEHRRAGVGARGHRLPAAAPTRPTRPAGRISCTVTSAGGDDRHGRSPTGRIRPRRRWRPRSATRRRRWATR